MAQDIFTTELSFSDKTGAFRSLFIPTYYVFSSDHNPCLVRHASFQSTLFSYFFSTYIFHK